MKDLGFNHQALNPVILQVSQKHSGHIPYQVPTLSIPWAGRNWLTVAWNPLKSEPCQPMEYAEIAKAIS